METIDPQLRASRSSAYVPQHAPPSSFPANTIRLPPPQRQQQLPSHDGGQAHPYYTLPHPPAHSNRQLLQTEIYHHHEPPPAADANEDLQHDPKRPRACEACRGLKVRCEPNASNPEGACRRCAKAGRQCIITFPSRKRQKKTDSRVAELEKRIDALTASLQATKRGEVVDLKDQSGGTSPEVDERSIIDTNGESPASPSDQTKPGGEINTSEWPRQPEHGYAATGLQSLSMPSPRSTQSSRSVVGQKRRRSDDDEDLQETVPVRLETSGVRRNSTKDNTTTYPSDVHQFLTPKDTRATKRSSIASVASTSSPTNLPAHEYADVIDRKILKARAATEIFDHYVRHMAPHFPAVVFPPDTSAPEIRRTKPTLFLAVLSVASGISHPDIQGTLSKELMRVYADRLIVKGEKTLELIQALQVSVIWYTPPEHCEESKFYQLIHIAAVMAMDLSLGKRTKHARPKLLGVWQDHPFRKTPLPDSHSVECRRAWLGCYFLCVNTSMALRRPNLLRWNSYTHECIEVLETSPNAYASDKVLCQWARIQHITEEISVQFSMDDPVAQVGGLDTKLQYTLKGFERQLEDWCKQIPTDLHSPSLKLSEHVVNLYMHEVAMHNDECSENVKCNTNTGIPLALLTLAHISALTVCLTSIHGLFDTFLSLATETIRNIPVFHFVRVAYACVLLIKMYFAATTPNAELGKVISKEDLKVEHYFDRLLNAFKTAAENEKSRAAQKFLVVLVMLRTWFHKQGGRQLDTSKDHNSKANMSSGSPSLQRSSDDELRKESTAPRLGGQQQIRLNDVMSEQPLTTASQDQNISPQPLHSMTTPLHLLSEVATGDSAVTSTPGRSMYTTTGQDWYGQINKDSTHSNSQVPGTTGVGFHYTGSSQNGDGALPNALDGVGPNFDWDATVVNEELEQAMNMTLGEWDLGSVLQADGFLFDLMGSDGGSTNVFEGAG